MFRRHLIASALLLTLAHAAFGQALPANTAVQKDVTFATVDGKPLKMDLYSKYPFGKRSESFNSPTLLRLAPHREAPNGAAADLLAKGYTLAYAEYLPASDNPNNFSHFPQDLHAAKAAIRRLRANAATLDINPDAIGLWGVGPGATIAALAAVTADQPALNGKLGDHPTVSSAVRALCLFEGVTDWRNAELYGDESVNIPGSLAYQLFGGDPKEHTEEARQASAVNYIRPTSPATLMVTLASDQHRAMHRIYAETLRRAGVPSALYEQPGPASGPVDESALNRTVIAFFEDTLQGDRAAPRPLALDQEIDTLAKAGLYKQARRLVDDQAALLPKDAPMAQRNPWIQKLATINDQEQQPALKQFAAARKTAASAGAAAPKIWTIREVLTDPERIGQYAVETSVSQHTFDTRAAALRAAVTLNNAILKQDAQTADRQAAAMKDLASRGDADPTLTNDFLTRYAQIKGKTSHVWPPGLRGMPYASDFGQDLFGYWMDLKAGGVVQRLRYIPPGRFTRGSALDEWGRLPGEPILEPTTISQGFWLAETEVTQGLYEAVLGASENHSAFRVAAADVRLSLPVENVSYAHAINFLNRLGIDARLPTAAEWEYACRANSTYMYAGTGRLSDMGWFWDEAKSAKTGANPVAPSISPTGDIDIRILHELETDSSDLARLTHPVKQKLPNAWGLYDMQGNVWEWCAGASPTQPRDFHLAKGGSWLSIPQSCRAARDLWLPIEQQSWNLGLRICIAAQ